MRIGNSAMQELVDRAERFAEHAHDGQTRKNSKEPFMVHPRGVAEMVAPHVSPAAVAAAFLHDVVEDTEYTDLSMFPSRTRQLVKLLTAIPCEDKIDSINRVARAADEEGILIKVADRVYNLRDGATSFSARWLKKYLVHSEALYRGAAGMGLEDHELVQKLRAVLDHLKELVMAGEPTKSSQ